VGSSQVPAVPRPESTLNEALEKSGVPGAKEAVEASKRALPIKEIAKEGSKGWKRSDLSPSQLGKKIDAAIAGLRGLDGGALLLLDIPEGKGEVRTALKVANPNKYMIQYNVVPTLAENHTLIADGIDKVESFKNAWSKPVPVASQGKAWDQRTIVKRWPEEFNRIMLMPLADRQPVWEKLLVGLTKGEEGYRSSLERQTFTWNNQTKPYYRLVANRPSDKAEMEIFVDGATFVPLTIIIKRRVDGKEHKVQWQAKWKFGASWEDKWFVIPTKSRAAPN
jgi:hypothetical protein